MTETESLELLEKVQAAMKIEARLTKRLAEVDPWLPSATQSHNPSLARVRPIPSTMDQVENVLALARALAARTSAPAGWNPNAPVIGFSTPSPMPHHLRGGALAALQLQRAQTELRESKRQKTRQQEEQDRTKQMEIDQLSDQQHGGTPATPSQLDPKRRELSVHNKDMDRSASDLERQEQQKRQQQRSAVASPPQIDVSMNLSDSSSEEDD